MPVYNAEHYLSEAIDSILRQSFSDFEFIIFNDGSIDGSAKIIESYNDPRIRFYNYQFNSGHVVHLNEGIRLARGKYIVRMDADDISHPLRLEKQTCFMENHTKIGLCGTWYDIIGEPEKVVTHPIDDQNIRLLLLKQTAFGHPTVMIRSEVLRRGNLWYKHEMIPAEDYQLWVEVSQFCQLANIPEVLLHYRRHQEQISKKRDIEQDLKAKMVRIYQLEMLFRDKLMEKDYEIWEALIFGYHLEGWNFLEKVSTSIKKLLKANEQNILYDPFALSSMLKNAWKFLLINSPQYNIHLLLAAYRSKGQRSFNLLSIKENIIFIIKCLIHWKQRSNKIL